MQHLKSLTVKGLSDIVISENQSIALIPEAESKTVLVFLINDISEFLNIKETLNTNQILSTVDLIIEEYGYMKPEDFKLCFNQAKKGYYGQVYNRIDGQVILSWLKEYAIERVEYFENHNTRKAQNQNDTRGLKTESMHSLYDKYVERSAKEEADLKVKKELEAELRKQAIEKWKADYNVALPEPTEHQHMEYISKYPLNEEYINHFIKINSH